MDSTTMILPHSVSVMTEQASSRSPPGSMNRPVHSPMGPRHRFPRSPSETTPRDSILSHAEPTPAYPSSPVRTDNGPLPPIAEFVPPPPPPTSSSANSLSPSPTPIYKIIPKPATLIPAPTLSFETEPIKWKALPHEAALWTLDRSELQEIVGRALRRTAPDTFIRLLSLDNLDTNLPAEVDRLTTLKACKQAQYRFLVQRRTMTLQALNSSFISPDKSEPGGDGIPIASKIALELSKVTAECDKIMNDLLVINDQLSQISMLTECHLSSALSVALRKLNKSYSKRTHELLCAEQRTSELQADLEDAWREAARLAREMDRTHAKDGLAPLEDGSDVENDDEDDYIEILKEEAVIKTAAKLKIHSRRASHIPTELIIQSRNKGHAESLPSFSPLSPMPGVSAMVPPSTIIEVAAESGPSTPSTPPSPSQDKDDAASVRSVRSAKSRRSIRSPEVTRLSLVNAARTRSLRASQNSLRISRPKTPAHPPMPDLPLELIGSPISSRSSRVLSRHLWKDSGSRISLARSRRTSLNDIRPERESAESLVPTVTMDDIYIRLQSQMTRRSDCEINVVSRTPPPMPRPSMGASPGIPDVWLMKGGPTSSPPKSSSSERFPSMKRPVQKLKSYTKRYSLPFPLFKRKPSQSSSSARSVSSSQSAPTKFH